MDHCHTYKKDYRSSKLPYTELLRRISVHDTHAHNIYRIRRDLCITSIAFAKCLNRTKQAKHCTFMFSVWNIHINIVSLWITQGVLADLRILVPIFLVTYDPNQRIRSHLYTNPNAPIFSKILYNFVQLSCKLCNIGDSLFIPFFRT